MSLYELQRDGDTEELLAMLRESESAAVRERAAELVEDDLEEAGVATLVEAASDDPDPDVRAAAVDALDRQGLSALEAFLADLAGVDAGGADWTRAESMVEVLDHDDPEARMAAATVLGSLDAPEAAPSLANRLDDPDPRVRERAATACGRLGVPGVRSALEAALDDAVPDVRREAASALGAIGGDRAVAVLRDALEDPDASVRREAATALGSFGTPAAVPDLVAALSDDAEAVRRAAVYSVVQLLSEAPPDRSHEVRESVVEELQTVEGSAVTEPLVTLLEESDQSGYRQNATWLLGRIGDGDDRRTVRALVDALDDDDATARFAATSLAAIGGTAVEGNLLDVVEDEGASSDARAMAAFTLGKVGGERARERLGRVVDETDDPEVRKRSFSALSKLGGV
ncbi:MAG: HEAT repeat domain-containing protein [Halobacteriaceae archaeon]